MNILLIIKNFSMGGAETHVRELANALAEQGHKVYLVGRDGNQKQQLDKRVQFVPLKLGDIGYVYFVFWLRRFIKRHNIQLVHGHQRMAISMGSWAARLTRVPCVATIHGQLKHDIRSRAVRKQLSQVICVRDETARQVAQCELLKDKSRVILNGVSEYPAIHSSEPFHIMYGSRHDQRHAWLILLLIKDVIPRLKARFPQLKLTVWGDGKCHDEIAAAANQCNQQFSQTVTLGGYTTKLGQEYQAADLVIACARSAMDALVAGRVTLAANYHHLGDVVSEQNYQRLKANNFEAKGYPKPDAQTLMDKVSDYFSNRDAYQTSMAALQSHILADLTVTASLASTLTVYNDAMKKHHHEGN